MDDFHDERRNAPAVREYHNRPSAGRIALTDLIGLARRLHRDGMPRHQIAEICGVRTVAAVDRLLDGRAP